MTKRRGQLFLIEVIIALTVLVILVSTLFSIQSYSPPVESNNLNDDANAIIDNLVQSGLMFEYLERANFSKFTLQLPVLNSTDPIKVELKNTIKASIPAIANYKVFTERYNEDTLNGTQIGWEQIDTVNLEQSLPTGSDLVLNEYYSPGFNGVYDQFKFKLYLWYEVSG